MRGENRERHRRGRAALRAPAGRDAVHEPSAGEIDRRDRGLLSRRAGDLEDILAENLKALSAELDDRQKDKLKAMQDAWATSRERTCAFYYDKIQGTMATILGAACLAQETARRALLLRSFQGL